MLCDYFEGGSVEMTVNRPYDRQVTGPSLFVNDIAHVDEAPNSVFVGRSGIVGIHQEWAGPPIGRGGVSVKTCLIVSERRREEDLLSKYRPLPGISAFP